MTTMTKPLAGQVALVAGATRAAGRGIARELAAAGAKVWCSGRSTREHPATPGRPETIEETAELIVAAGGAAVAVRVDHQQEAEVEALAARIRAEDGRLDILVNDIWGGDEITQWGAPFWKLDMTVARTLLDQAVFSHLITSRHMAPMMVEANRGLIVEVTDGSRAGYRGQLAYDWVKSSISRLAYAMAWDLARTGVTALAVSPGFLRSEAMLDRFGVGEDNWRDAVEKEAEFAYSETPHYVGRAVAALAADPRRRPGRGIRVHRPRRDPAQLLAQRRSLAGRGVRQGRPFVGEGRVDGVFALHVQPPDARGACADLCRTAGLPGVGGRAAAGGGLTLSQVALGGGERSHALYFSLISSSRCSR